MLGNSPGASASSWGKACPSATSTGDASEPTIWRVRPSATTATPAPPPTSRAAISTTTSHLHLDDLLHEDERDRHHHPGPPEHREADGRGEQRVEVRGVHEQQHRREEERQRPQPVGGP